MIDIVNSLFTGILPQGMFWWQKEGKRYSHGFKKKTKFNIQGFVLFISRICLVYYKDLSGLFAGSAKCPTLGSPGIFVLKSLPE